MSAALICGCLWVLLATVTAMLRMRHQMWPGLVLLATAPVLLVWIAMTHGWIWLVPALLAFGSMMRNPLIYLWKRARGQEVEIPAEIRAELGR